MDTDAMIFFLHIKHVASILRVLRKCIQYVTTPSQLKRDIFTYH